jgi:hypothetical protein
VNISVTALLLGVGWLGGWLSRGWARRLRARRRQLSIEGVRNRWRDD